jgi:acid stress-induced BolA-like protein IbaG/YrbA
MQPEEIKKMIETYLPDAQVEVKGDDGVHFEAIVISSQFVGKTRVQQQQAVYAALREPLASGRLHALSLKTQEKIGL